MRSTFLTLHWVILLMVLDILYFLTVWYSKYFITSFSGCGQSISAHSPVLSLISPISLDSRLKRIFKCLSTQSHSYTNPSCPWSSHLDCSCSHQVDPGVCSLSLLLFRAWKRGLMGYESLLLASCFPPVLDLFTGLKQQLGGWRCWQLRGGAALII